MQSKPRSFYSRWIAAAFRAGIVLVLAFSMFSVFWYVALSALIAPGRLSSTDHFATILSLAVAVPLALVQFWLAFHDVEVPRLDDASPLASRTSVRDELIFLPPVVFGSISFVALLVISSVEIAATTRSALLTSLGVGDTLASATFSACCGWMAAGKTIRRVILACGGAVVGFLGHILFFVIAWAVLRSFGFPI